VFEGFETFMIDAGGAMIWARHGGSGPPLLLPYGNPQTHTIWHEVAPRLAEDFTVVATDLRGYSAVCSVVEPPSVIGAKSLLNRCPKGLHRRLLIHGSHASRSLQAVIGRPLQARDDARLPPLLEASEAQNQVAVMRKLGFERFKVCGHDRGGR
jgi:haloacetate dehalogenase